MSDAKTDEKLASYLKRFSPSPSRDPDAGLRALPHYERKLPRWRYRLRQWLIPVMRWETPYLANIQDTVRSNFLDSYFALTANLGTHTCYMTLLPICFWCGFPDLGIALVHMLAMGVYLSGALKDLLCLPRPLSPPLQRITMSGSAALEYGFPSTHATNAVSVAVFALHQLSLTQDDYSIRSYKLLRFGCYCYGTSITLGRMYCGMHGFFDVLIGAILGAAIAWFRICYGQLIDVWIIDGGWSHPALAVTLMALAIRFHPEPADDCPCFDDSVAFLGVVMGTSIGTWHYAHQQDVSDKPALVLADFYQSTFDDAPKAAGRLIGGILVIFLWRAVMKPLLLGYLPAVFRFVDQYGLSLPRRYFLQAREYKNVPSFREDDNVLPSASDIPSLLSSFRHPRRRRVSVGPQSEADAREYLAYRSSKTRESGSTSNPYRTTQDSTSIPEAAQLNSSRSVVEAQQTGHDADSPINPLKASTQVDVNHNGLLAPPPSQKVTEPSKADVDRDQNDQRMFSALEKPRTHYDVEVITKLVVYTGIAWLATEGNPMLFDALGLD